MKKKFILTLVVLLFTTTCFISCGKKDERGPVVANSTKEDTTGNSQENSQSETQEEDLLTTVSMAEFLSRAKEPVGTTLYVWGGGWNEADDGAGIEAVTLGVSENWRKFFEANDKNYDYHDTKYQIHDGLDCSGYVGWVVYNTFESKNGNAGYVMASTDMAKTFAGKGWGTFTVNSQVSDWKAGDIMSMKGHVWIALGTCEDGSVVLMHSSPPGVRISGTHLEDGSTSMAEKLAQTYMAKYSEWSSRYSDCGVDYSYLTKSSQMRWNSDTFSDAEKFQNMTAKEVLEWLFK